MPALYITADDGFGNVQTMLVTDYQAQNPGSNVRVASANFSFQYNGVTLSFIANTAYDLKDATLWAQLQAAGLPIA